MQLHASAPAVTRFSRLLVLVATVFLAGQASAVPIYLGQTTGSPSDLESVFGRLTTQISLYNTTHEPDLPTALFAGAIKTNVGGDLKSFSLDISGWDYLVLKAGPKNYHYYVGDDTGLTAFTTPKGLSNYSFFKAYVPPPEPPRLPEHGASILLIAPALLGLALLRRKSRK